MSTYKGEIDNTQEQGIRELLARDGYSEVVIDHWLNPRNFGQMGNYDGYSGKTTSSCGDSMWVWLEVKDDTIQDATFISDICIGAISSGSMLAEMIRGKKIIGALQLSSDDILKALGGLPENFVHCATLAEAAVKAAIRYYNAYKAPPWKRLYQRKP